MSATRIEANDLVRAFTLSSIAMGPDAKIPVIETIEKSLSTLAAYAPEIAAGKVLYSWRFDEGEKADIEVPIASREELQQWANGSKGSQVSLFPFVVDEAALSIEFSGAALNDIQSIKSAFSFVASDQIAVALALRCSEAISRSRGTELFVKQEHRLA